MCHSRLQSTRSRRDGFSLIEILIVVALLAILAAVVVPAVQTSTREAEQVSFVADLRIFADAAMRYRFESGQHLADAAPGVVPPGWASYVDEEKWGNLTPIGGAWDTAFNLYGVKSSFGVNFVDGGGADRDDAYMQEIDRIFDDANLLTGQFRKVSPGRYFFVLAE